MRGLSLTSPQCSIAPCQNHALWASFDIFANIVTKKELVLVGFPNFSCTRHKNVLCETALITPLCKVLLCPPHNVHYEVVSTDLTCNVILK